MNKHKTKTNAQSVKDYHKKLVNLAIVRVPNKEISGIDYKEQFINYLCERFGQKRTGVPNKSMNEYILDLINEDMNKYYSSKKIKRGVKQFKE